MNTDDIIDVDGSVIKPGRGGARAGAGRKPSGYVKPKEAVDFDKAKARKEAALADLHELDYKVKSGQYVSRDEVRQASATAFAQLAQSLRSIPDTLERKGVPTAVCLKVEAVLTEGLAEAAQKLAKIHGESLEQAEIADAEEANADLF